MSNKNKPVIGVSCSMLRNNRVTEVYGGGYIDYVHTWYIRGLEKAGAVPLILPVTYDSDNVSLILDTVDGLLLSGGVDISPRVYGCEPIPGIARMEYKLDLFEVELARLALERKTPTLGICRGLQIISAAFGGTLIQDIPKQVKDSLEHFQTTNLYDLTHKVQLEESSRLRQIIGESQIWVNSAHHQAVNKMPDGFIKAAQASDGVIEALEHPDLPFFIGVQWHPEASAKKDENSQKIFRAFIEASRN